MTIKHHPSNETLVAFVNGTLDEANTLVVATHLAHCQECRTAVRQMAEVGGNLLAMADPVEVGPSSRDSCLSKLDSTPIEAVGSTCVLEGPAVEVKAAPRRVLDPMAFVELYGSGNWKWLGPGVYRQDLDVPSDDGTRAFILKAAPGTRLPDHSHEGTEWTCVLKGAFRHDHGRFGIGDFDEADSSVDHNPYVEEGEECICLVALNGDVRMKSWIGRLIQPLVRI